MDRDAEVLEMRVLVAGGTGVLGSAVVDALKDAGHDPVVLSRRAATAYDGTERRAGDLASGAGLAQAVRGIDAVVDAASPRGRHPERVLVEGTRRLLAAAAQAGVGTYAVVSIVGVDRVPFGYYRAKVAQERVLTEGRVPWTLLRATQFPQLLDGFLAAAAKARVLPLLRGVPIQPVDPRDVAEVLVGSLAEGPAGRLPDVAGPEILDAADAARLWQSATARRADPLPLRIPGAAGKALRAGALTAPDRAVGTRTFADWLEDNRTTGDTTKVAP
jgi:uncharacterized protein YbjT (DUF2867 family)